MHRTQLNRENLKGGFNKVASIYVDESGAKNHPEGLFVLGFVKLYQNGRIQRRIKALRDTFRFTNEIKFSSITKGSLEFYFHLVEMMGAENLRIGASIYRSDTDYHPGVPTWKTQSNMAAQLASANINKNEFANIFVDLVSTREDCSMSEIITRSLRKKLNPPNVFKVYELDSTATDLLQLADLVAGSIRYMKLRGDQVSPKPNPKRQVASRLMRVYELESFDDIQEKNVNILTMNNIGF